MEGFVMRKALLLVMAVVTGCGAPLMAPQAMAPGAETFAKRAKTFRYGLGCKLDGLQKMADDDSGFQTKASLPEKIDLRAGCSPISNQGQTNACVGFATVDGLGEYLAAKQGRRMNLSPRYVWNLTRQMEKSLDGNVGTWPHDAMKVADNLGIALEADFPTPAPEVTEDNARLMPLVTERPSNDVVARAKKNRLFKGWKAITSVHAMKKSVADGMPVVFAINVYASIGSVGTNGIIPSPKANEEAEGGHAIVCVGYDNARRLFIIRNSWGTGWGDKGYGYLPYDYFKTGNAYEGFTAKP
jgi:C1A family cysteine protease